MIKELLEGKHIVQISMFKKYYNDKYYDFKIITHKEVILLKSNHYKINNINKIIKKDLKNVKYDSSKQELNLIFEDETVKIDKIVLEAEQYIFTNMIPIAEWNCEEL